LKTLVAGGEAMTPEVINKFASGLQLCNGYGPTEGTVFAVTNDQVSTQQDASNIGHVTQSGRSWLTIPSQPHKLAPIGAIAELCIEGPFLARGYLNNPSKTAESFVENPAFLQDMFKTTKGRIYRTGDLVQYASDGSIRYIGRKDNQVKLAGQRVELGEIEHHLQTDTSIVHAVVQLPKTGIVKGKLTVAVSFAGASAETRDPEPQWNTILETPGISSKISQSRERLCDLVPAYMVPAVWVAVPHIPLLASAKVDKKQVGAWLENIDTTTYQKILNLENVEVAAVPKTETTTTLHGIWAKVLGIPVGDINTSRSWLCKLQSLIPTVIWYIVLIDLQQWVAILLPLCNYSRNAGVKVLTSP
jgi:acyl-CoA synthetase (AMP-forming)/AMP-acid ligase II